MSTDYRKKAEPITLIYENPMDINPEDLKIKVDTAQHGRIIPAELAFTCHICGGLQPCGYWDRIVFPVCDQCKKYLRDFVLSKREKQIPE